MSGAALEPLATKQRLTGLDSTFLNIESSRLYAYIGSTVILDPSGRPDGALDLATLTALFEERLHLMAPFRRKLAQVPLGLGRPYWVDDDGFDLSFHLRESAIPAPGDDDQLAAMVARTFARPLDRRRPLWEFWLVHGLSGGRVALLTKIHHALLDGVAGNEILSVLLDERASGRVVPRAAGEWMPRPAPGELELLRDGLLGIVSDSVRAARRTPGLVPLVTDLPGADLIPGVPATKRLVRRLRGKPTSRSLLESSASLAPQTPFNGPLSGHLRWSFGTLELERIKAVKKAAQVTVNDVVVCLCAAALREWLLERDALPDDPLVTAVPISVRGTVAGGPDAGGNRIGMVVAPIPTDEPDPLVRLGRVGHTLSGAKERHGALPADALTDVATFLPPAVAARAARISLNVLARVQPPVNLLISNVPGPRKPLYCAGAEMTGYFPVPPIMDGVALNMTVVSYLDHLEVGIIADREQVPEPDELLDGMRTALAELEAALGVG